MTDMIHIDTAQFGDEEIQAVSAKQLHEFLQLSKRHYTRWIANVVLVN